jgi:hypothetical protein
VAATLEEVDDVMFDGITASLEPCVTVMDPSGLYSWYSSPPMPKWLLACELCNDAEDA